MSTKAHLFSQFVTKNGRFFSLFRNFLRTFAQFFTPAVLLIDVKCLVFAGCFRLTILHKAVIFLELRMTYAPVAQLDRASVYGTEGYKFESCQARYKKAVSRQLT